MAMGSPWSSSDDLLTTLMGAINGLRHSALIPFSGIVRQEPSRPPAEPRKFISASCKAHFASSCLPRTYRRFIVSGKQHYFFLSQRRSEVHEATGVVFHQSCREPGLNVLSQLGFISLTIYVQSVELFVCILPIDLTSRGLMEIG